MDDIHAAYNAARRRYRAEVLTNLAKKGGADSVYSFLAECEATAAKRGRRMAHLQIAKVTALIAFWIIGVKLLGPWVRPYSDRIVEWIQ